MPIWPAQEPSAWIHCQLAVLSGRFTPIDTHLPDAPERLQAFFVGALALEPSRRPSRAPLLVADLEHALA